MEGPRDSLRHTQYSVMTYMGKESKKEWTHVCICICTDVIDLLCCAAETNTIL